jgi:hypothetical protein
MIGAFGALANGVELEFFEQGAGLAEAAVDGQLEAEPLRQARAGLGRQISGLKVHAGSGFGAGNLESLPKW